MSVILLNIGDFITLICLSGDVSDHLGLKSNGSRFISDGTYMNCSV